MTTIYHKNTTINKIHFEDLSDMMADKGLNHSAIQGVLNTICGDDDYAYVSNGFLRGMSSDEIEMQEWHHYFIKDGSEFSAGKLNFHNLFN
jgi:hypothetical protein